MMKKIFLIVTLFYVSGAFAQTGSVKGFIFDKETGEPVLFTNVILKGTTFGAATDVNGFYAITKVPAGSYELMVTYLGYDSLVVDIDITPGKPLTKNLYLQPASITIQDIVVSAEKEEMKNQVHTAVVKISPRQIEKLPSVGAEVDIAQYIQVVPGVVFTGDQGGQLYIRGGAPIHNKVLLDGMTIYNPFHSIGMFSVFDTDLLLNADIYTGGFNAEYGGRISSIMDLRTRQGNKKKFSGKVSANTFASRVLLEGPLKKFTKESPSSLTYALSLKHSYLEQTSKKIYDYVDEDGLPFNFTDIYGKVSLTGESGNKFNVFGFNFTDRVNYQGTTDLEWSNGGGGATAVVVPSQSNSIIDFHVNFSDYEISMETSEIQPSTSSIRDFGFGLGVKSFIGKNEISFGFDFSSYATDYTFYNAYGFNVNHQQNTAEYSTFMQFKGQWGDFIVEPGVRLIYYASLGEPSLEPRLGMKYKISENLRLKASGGFYSQNLIAANSQRSVVDLFYGFLSSPESLPASFRGEEVETKLQKAKHVVGGIEYDVNNRITVNFESYYKYMNPLININPNKRFGENTAFNDIPDILKTSYMFEQGDAYGFDLSLKYDYKRWYVWTVGSWGYVNRTGYFYDDLTQEAQLIEYPPHFDRRLSVNVLTSYTFGARLNWVVSMRWNYGSGLPFTSSVAYYESLSLNSMNDDYSNTAGDIGTIYGGVNERRLTAYHRLDFNVKRKFYLKGDAEVELVASLTNVYDRNNVFYVNRLANEVIYQLPILPSFGMTFKF
ncbi:MAG TPA: TonB-dependent receptor [Salinivirga sp.]|uniref:TonB-dependent receptor n=1 Tax=Salinivirga sp. TaxID=1970192 RepID=UPI002B45921F|nr:TonB-dependent receptor [Salinivirga sp.]HKK58385.1 TonB-dependent receptor [Salinivirga sp.]